MPTFNPDVIVVCGEDGAERYEMWLKVLFRAGADSVAVVNTTEGGFVVTRNDTSRRSAFCWNDIVDPVRVVLVHQGDSGYWTGKVKANRVMWFDTPGTPKGRTGDFKIRRCTGARNFEVTEEDGREILAFGCGSTSEPSCCSPKVGQSYIPAIAILCQGFLSVYAKEPRLTNSEPIGKALSVMGWKDGLATLVVGRLEEVQVADWWLEALGLRADMLATGSSPVRGAKLGGFRASFSTEWGGRSLPDGIKGLIDDLESGSDRISAVTVATAYLAIRDHLMGGKHYL